MFVSFEILGFAKQFWNILLSNDKIDIEVFWTFL